ncbi:MAG TPA: chemotaxis protein CheA [Negativicutes bacterium]|nr:chemotaxis protein CheA [Negativicutes bacterium]
MADEFSGESMLDMYLFETEQNLEQLEAAILSSEKTNRFTSCAIDEIFRIMHTIKGSSGMMLYNGIATLAHSIEDLFYYLREVKDCEPDCQTVSDLVFEGVDFIKVELQKIRNGDRADGSSSRLIMNNKAFLEQLKSGNPSCVEDKAVEAAVPELEEKQKYYIAPYNKAIHKGNYFKAVIFFEDGCEMENIRAYTIIHSLKEFSQEVTFFPEDILDNDDSTQVIKEKGFKIYVAADKSYGEMKQFFTNTVFLKDMELVQLESDDEFRKPACQEKIVVEESPIKVPKLQAQENSDASPQETTASVAQSIISVNVEKLDKLMDLVGEMVIAEAMVTQNPDLKGLELNNFHKAARQLHKITSEFQDMVMSIRMVPLATTFHKMQRIVRDMSRKLGKEVQLKLIGEETEVDKNIIEHISDPLMHLIRNSIDHGIEAAADRESYGKPKAGTVTLEARNAGSDVLVIVRDDGKGLNKEKILQKARERQLLTKHETEMTDKEIYSLIFLPGFSTKDDISEFSGRGVGMDVVTKNLVEIGGSVAVDSAEGVGTVITLKIPLTLAIIDGMNIKVGSSRYTIPIISIKESFRPKKEDIIIDPDGNEMIMVRGQCYPVLRLHEHFRVKTDIRGIDEGILIMVDQEERSICLFADELLGQQQVVVKALPGYIKSTRKIQGLAGCTLLGDGSISLILDIAGLMNIKK